MDKMWAIDKQINSGNYDYKMPTPLCPESICHVPYINTAANLFAKAIDVDLKPILEEKKIWAPGIDGHLDHTIMDRFVKTSLENNAEYKANLAKYGEYTEEEFKALGLDYIMAQNQEKAKEFLAARDKIATQSDADFEHWMKGLNLEEIISASASKPEENTNIENALGIPSDRILSYQDNLIKYLNSLKEGYNQLGFN